MQQRIDADLKSAMLAGDKVKAEILRNLKSAILNEAIAQNVRDAGLSDEQIQKVLAREAKKRAEAAELYDKNGAKDRAEKELAEKKLIEEYLPEQASEEDIKTAVNAQISKASELSMADMGRIIGAVRAQLGGAADGAVIAKLVKEAIESKW